MFVERWCQTFANTTRRDTHLQFGLLCATTQKRNSADTGISTEGATTDKNNGHHHIMCFGKGKIESKLGQPIFRRRVVCRETRDRLFDRKQYRHVKNVRSALWSLPKQTHTKQTTVDGKRAPHREKDNRLPIGAVSPKGRNAKSTFRMFRPSGHGPGLTTGAEIVSC